MKKAIIFLIAIMLFKFSYSQISPTDTTPLIRLVKFEATPTTTNKTKLYWQVSCYYGSAHFKIQRSTNGINFTEIDELKANFVRCLQPFEQEEENINANAYYRINIIDNDGNQSFSKVLLVVSKNNRFEISSLTPTIITSNTNLNISSAFAQKVEITIHNQQGTVIKNIAITLNVGYNNINLNLSQLAQGYYIINVHNQSSQNKIVRFLKS